MQPIFVTGIGTGVGKTIVSAIVTQALEADYWKPIQAGFEEGTDCKLVKSLVSNNVSQFIPEVYNLQLPASPHIAAKQENVTINVDAICEAFNNYKSLNPSKQIIIEGAGGLLVPINENQFIVDLIKALNAKVILVSKNYLGSINHSLLTANTCKHYGLDVFGWIFNDHYMNYEDEIVQWTSYKKIASIPKATTISVNWISVEASRIKNNLI